MFYNFIRIFLLIITLKSHSWKVIESVIIIIVIIIIVIIIIIIISIIIIIIIILLHEKSLQF